MDELFYYSLRITPYPNTEAKTKFVRENIERFLKEIFAIDYICGQEYERNHHFHIVFSHPTDIKGKTEINNVRDKLYAVFDVPDNKRGNATFSLEPIRKLDESLSYAVKDGNYFSSPNWEELSHTSYSNSHSKKHSLKSSLSDISQRFMDGDMNERELWIELCLSRSQLGLPLSIRWVDEMVLSYRLKKNPDLAKDMWEERNISKN